MSEPVKVTIELERLQCAIERYAKAREVAFYENDQGSSASAARANRRLASAKRALNSLLGVESVKVSARSE